MIDPFFMKRDYLLIGLIALFLFCFGLMVYAGVTVYVHPCNNASDPRC